MPGAKSKTITANIGIIQELQVQVSAWASRLAGLKVKTDMTVEDYMKELLEHVSGLGHLEVLKVAELSKIDTKSAAYKFQQAVNALALSWGKSHGMYQENILKLETLDAQEKKVKEYAQARVKSLNEFKTKWHIDTFPSAVTTALEKAKKLG